VLQRDCVAYLKALHPDIVTYRHDGGDRLFSGGHAAAKISFMEGGRCVGAPDLLILLRGADGSGFLAVEFKSLTGSVRPQQREAHARLREQRGSVHVVNSLDAFKRALQDHTAPQPVDASGPEVVTISDSEDEAPTLGRGRGRRLARLTPLVGVAEHGMHARSRMPSASATYEHDPVGTL